MFSRSSIFRSSTSLQLQLALFLPAVVLLAGCTEAPEDIRTADGSTVHWTRPDTVAVRVQGEPAAQSVSWGSPDSSQEAWLAEHGFDHVATRYSEAKTRELWLKRLHALRGLIGKEYIPEARQAVVQELVAEAVGSDQHLGLDISDGFDAGRFQERLEQKLGLQDPSREEVQSRIDAFEAALEDYKEQRVFGRTYYARGTDTGGSGAAAGSANAPPVVDVTAVGYVLQAPDSIRSGWVTFQLENQGNKEGHNFALYRIPEGRTFAELGRARFAPMDSIRRLVWKGAVDSSKIAQVRKHAVPDWAYPSNLKSAGGVAAVSPDHTGRATTRLAPGNYVMMCVLPDSLGRDHYKLGMRRGLTVTEESSGASPPEPDVTMRTSTGEINIEGSFSEGEQVVALHVGPPPEGTDTPHRYATLGRLDSTGSPREAQLSRLGGLENVPQGEAVYSTVDLKPGRYAWFFWHPEKDRRLHHEFVVE